MEKRAESELLAKKGAGVDSAELELLCEKEINVMRMSPKEGREAAADDSDTRKNAPVGEKKRKRDSRPLIGIS